MISMEVPWSLIFDQGFPYSAMGSSTSIGVVVVILEVSEVVSRGPSLFNRHAIAFSWWSQFHVVNIEAVRWCMKLGGNQARKEKEGKGQAYITCKDYSTTLKSSSDNGVRRDKFLPSKNLISEKILDA